MQTTKKLKVLDLFSGCGGLSRGFIDAGYEVVLGVDNNAIALETFKENHGNAKALNIDLFDKKAIEKIEKEVGGKVDVIVAGPPCQGFSLTGSRNFDDKRNRLYLSVIEAVNSLKPKTFLIENVPGLARLYGGAIKDEIINRLSESGYNVKMKILCAADYGVPQMRTRVFFVGLQKKYGEFAFPEPTHTPSNYVTCSDAISDLPELDNELGTEESQYSTPAKTQYQMMMRKNSTKLYNHVATKHTDLVKSVISLVPEGGNHKDLPLGIGESRKFNEAWTRYHSKKPSKTIDTGHRNHFHYQYNRIPTVRENARLQSFPDNFRFLGTRTEQNRQVGNAVPPLLGYHIGRQILSHLNKKKHVGKKNKRIKTLDLFAGCGGLTEGFEMTSLYETVAGVEWDKPSRDTLANRLKEKWGYQNSEERVLRYDIQKTKELLDGWSNDSMYGSGPGFNALVRDHGGYIDLIVGGPPCQAYSVAGRIRDENGMNDDYRNFLFEKYVALVSHFRPHAFIFENVPGMLSARPGGISIAGKVREAFSKIGYSLINDFNRYALIDASEYGVPQNRKRLVLLGIRDNSFDGDPQELLKDFYTRILPAHKRRKVTVAEAIFDLPKFRVNKGKGKKPSHIPLTTEIPNHVPRYHNERDRAIFRELALDVGRASKKYGSVVALKKLYTEKTGKDSSVHKYYVLDAHKQSNTIVSHLYKDGLRHIHPDPEQARSITVREAARLQSFPDDFVFLGSMGDQYRMIGNAVPPLLAKAIASSVASFLADNLVKKSSVNIPS